MSSDRIEQLSPREREVLALAGKGMSSKEIARHLQISPRTVDTHVGNAIASLGVRNRLEAALLLEQGASVELRRQPQPIAARPADAAQMPPDRSELTRWWRLPILRNGRLDNDLTTISRLAWIFLGAVAIIFVFSQLANGLLVAQEIALGFRR